MAEYTVLVVDDDEKIREMVRAVMEGDGYCVYSAPTLGEGRRLALEKKPTVAILDRILPDGDGMQLCLQLRDDPSMSGLMVIMLTGKNQPVDRVLGLKFGADDYLAKPFEISELSARVAALIRRRHGNVGRGPVLAAGRLKMNLNERTVACGERNLPLTNMEFDLLRVLMEKPGEVLTREQLLETVWDAHVTPVIPKTVDVTVMTLRRKLGPLSGYIAAVRGIGYKFSAAR